jgi:predicted metal-dependent hydrolase
MVMQISLGDITVDVVKKDIKNVHLSVYPPSGTVRISAPLDMDVATIRVFAVSKLGWVKQQQRKLREQQRAAVREYVDRESHYVWGRRYLLKVIDSDDGAAVELKHRCLVLSTRAGASHEKRQSLLDHWYRMQLKEAAPIAITRWEKVLGVKVRGIFVQRMKTRWGSCNAVSGTLRLNTELAKKPRECLEYILVHEMVHLLEPTHNGRFVALMDQYMPNWRMCRDELNRLPVRHESWRY